MHEASMGYCLAQFSTRVVKDNRRSSDFGLDVGNGAAAGTMFQEQQIKFAGSGKPNVGVLRSSHTADARDHKQSQRKKTAWADCLTQYLIQQGVREQKVR